MTSDKGSTTKSEWKYETETDSLLNDKQNVSNLKDDHIHGNENDQKIKGFISDAFDTLSLAVPIFISRLSWVGMTTTDTSLLGHVGADALAAQALSDLWTMCTGVFIQGRVLSIICGQAVGANNIKLAATYLQVSIVVIGIISVLVILAWNCTSILWRMFGESDELSAQAGYFASVTSFSIPAQVIFSQLSQYFFAMRITRPEVISSICALTFNLIFGLMFVLGIPIPEFSGFGFFACPIITTLVEYVNVFVFVCIVYTFHKHLLYKWEWKEITKERVLIYTKLYVPAAFSVASDFWRMAFIGFVAAKLGNLEVAVFNTSYRIMWITLTFIGATSGASGIKMGLRLGSGDHNGAKQAGEICVAISVVVLAILSALLLWDIRAFGEIFSSDESFLDLLEESKVPFVATLTFMNLACAVEKIPISMGRTADVFWMGFIGSWLGQVPGVVILTKYWRDDLYGLYSGMAVGYFLLVILYCGLVYTSDWKEYSDIARKRSEVSGKNQAQKDSNLVIA